MDWSAGPMVRTGYEIIFLNHDYVIFLGMSRLTRICELPVVVLGLICVTLTQLYYSLFTLNLFLK